MQRTERSGWKSLHMFSTVPNWFLFPSDSPESSSNPKERLKRAEDQVQSDLTSRDQLYRLIAYKYLHASGLRIATVNTEISRALGK